MKTTKMRFMFQQSEELKEKQYVKLAYRLYDNFDKLGYDDAEIVDSTDVSTDSERLHEITIAFEVKEQLNQDEMNALEEAIDDAVTDEGHMFVKFYLSLTSDK